MKRLLSIVLASLLAFSCAACSIRTNNGQPAEAPQDQTQPAVVNPVGKWQTTAFLGERVTEDLYDFEYLSDTLLLTQYDIVLNLELREDGTYRVWADEASVEQAKQQLRDELKSSLWQTLELMFVDPELELTLEEALKKENIDPDQILAEAWQKLESEDGALTYLQQRTNMEGNYLVEEDILMTSDTLDGTPEDGVISYFSLDEDGLYIIDSYSQELSFSCTMLFPMEFVRVD